jgi:formamidopyrimidine-DNA glycosylase
VWWRGLPPRIDDRRFTARWLARHFERRRRSPVKAVLLDQGVFPGIGNWMADEILWRAGLHPCSAGHSLTAEQLVGLWKTTRWVARRAIEIIGIRGDDPPSSWLFRHRWSPNHRCPRCERRLRRGVAAGRTTCWCPACQPRVKVPRGSAGRTRRPGRGRPRQ